MSAPDTGTLIRSTRFRAEREAGWRRLELLLVKTEKRGIAALEYQESLDLSDLYRNALNALSVARSISLDQALLTYLDALCARGYLVVYAQQDTLRGMLGQLLRRDIPRAVRRSVVPLAIAALALVLGTITGYVLYHRDIAWYFTFVPPDLAGGRTPSATAGYLRNTLFDTASAQLGRDVFIRFVSYLFSHNTQIAILTFALGIFAVLPSFALTFYNGLMLGALWALFADKGLGYEVTGWLSIHGVTELSAVIVACAGGTQLGLAVLLPGQMTRSAALRKRGPDAVRLFALAAVMLVVAALVEGVLRQVVQSTPARLAIGWGLGALWLVWLTTAGRTSQTP